MTEQKLIDELTEAGRSQYDRMQRNLSRICGMTDGELIAEPDAMAMFNQPQPHPEERREEARRTQNKLDNQGREAYAKEYAVNQAKNYNT